MKRLLSLVLCVSLMLCGGVALASDAPLVEPPHLGVTAGDVPIVSASSADVLGGAELYIEDAFRALAKGGIEPKRIPLGTTITMRIDGPQPDNCRLTDYILTEDGEIKYQSDVESEPIPLAYDEEMYSFDLPVNMSAMFSSNTGDYMPGRTIRGFSVQCKWGETAHEYAFLLRTDAHPTFVPDGTTAQDFGFISIELPFELVPSNETVVTDADGYSITMNKASSPFSLTEDGPPQFMFYHLDITTELSREEMGRELDQMSPFSDFLNAFESGAGRDLNIEVADGDLAAVTEGRIDGKPAMFCALWKDKSVVVIAATFDDDDALLYAEAYLNTIRFKPDDYASIQSVDVVFKDGYIVHMTFEDAALDGYSVRDIYNDALERKAEGDDNMNIIEVVYAEDETNGKQNMPVNGIPSFNSMDDKQITYGMTRSEIEGMIGQSKESSAFGDVYQGITIRYRDDQLAFLQIESDSWSVNNVTVGSSVKSLVDAFGLQEIDGMLNYTIAYYGDDLEPTLLTPFNDIDTNYAYALDFAVSDGVVHRIMFGDRDALVYMR